MVEEKDCIYTRVKTLNLPLIEQIERLKHLLLGYQQQGFLGAILFGSCSKGRATYRSDIDILLVFDQEDLNFSMTHKTRNGVEEYFKSQKAEGVLLSPLPVEFQVVRRSVFLTKEPEMLKNLKQGILLVDKQDLLKNELKIS